MSFWATQLAGLHHTSFAGHFDSHKMQWCDAKTIAQ
jgi:hypothetical protein